jgi:hypothetical protein
MGMSEYDIVTMMLKYGGGFAQALAEAWMKADLDNQRRIKDAFPDLFEQYKQMRERMMTQR